MMKAVKVLVAAVAAVVVLAAIAVLALPLWIGPVVKIAVGKVGPAYTGTPVHLGVFELNPYCGRLGVGDFQLWNPEGYSEKMAATLGSFVLRVDPTSVFSDVIRIREITVNDVFVSYIGTGNGGFTGEKNLDRIALKAIGPSYTNKTQVAAKPVKQDGAGEAGEKSALEMLGERKVIIDVVSVNGVLVKVGGLTLPLPVPTIRNIGASSGGITFDAAWREIWTKIMNSAGAVGGSAKDLGLKGLKLGQEGLDFGKKGAADAIKHTGDALKNTGDKLQNVGKDLKKLLF